LKTNKNITMMKSIVQKNRRKRIKKQKQKPLRQRELQMRFWKRERKPRSL
jgi:hypothetical protein